MPEDEAVTQTSVDDADVRDLSSTALLPCAWFYAVSGTAEIPCRIPLKPASPPERLCPAATHPKTQSPPKNAQPESSTSPISVPSPTVPEVKQNLSWRYFGVLLLSAFVAWISRSVPSPLDPPRPLGQPHLRTASQIVLNAPDGKPFIVRMYGDPKQVAKGVQFCTEAFPEVESLGEPSYDNSQFELDEVMHLKRSRKGPTADCYEISHFGTEETLTIRYPARFKKAPSGASPALKLFNSGDGYSFDPVAGPRSSVHTSGQKPTQLASGPGNVITGQRLATVLNVGLNTSENQTDWLTVGKDLTFKLIYPSGQDWAAVFLTFGPANDLLATNRHSFYVYRDTDSWLNHGFPSGVFGTKGVNLDAACIDDPKSPMDYSGFVRCGNTLYTFETYFGADYEGLNWQEPEKYSGYDLTTASRVRFDVLSPGALSVLFGSSTTLQTFDQVSQNTAIVYDNAVGLLALLRQGKLQDIADIRIAAALNYAPQHDSQGGLHNAYQGGDIALVGDFNGDGKADMRDQTSSYTYDTTGKLVSVTDGNGNTTRFVYDTLGRTLNLSYPDGRVTSDAYDVNGSRLAIKADTSLVYEYDALGRATRVLTEDPSDGPHHVAALVRYPFPWENSINSIPVTFSGSKMQNEECLAEPFQCIAERTGLAATAWAVLADGELNSLGTVSASLSTIGGHVLEAKGSPVTGVMIVILGTNSSLATTAPDGSFQINVGLGSGGYAITPSKSGYVFAPSMSAANGLNNSSAMVGFGPNEVIDSGASIYYLRSRSYNPSLGRFVAPHEETLTGVRPLAVRMLSSGGAHLTVTSEVNPSAVAWNAYRQGIMDDAIPVRPLHVRMINSGGAHLTVTSEVDPSAECGEDQQIRQQPVQTLRPWRAQLISLPRSIIGHERAALFRRRLTWLPGRLGPSPFVF